jgi:hypothetical protein
MLIQAVLEMGISVTIAFAMGAARAIDWSPAIYVYLCFSFLWISVTLGYTVYLTLAGIGASWYFLNDTEHMPRSPIFPSLKRALTTSFGSAAFAGLIMAVIELLKIFIHRRPDRNENACIAIMRCLAMCILHCIEACFSYVARYALIYCAAFGVPFKEGCRRWVELSCKRFADLVVSGSIIKSVLVLNMLTFTIGTALVGLGLGTGMFSSKHGKTDLGAAMAVVAAMVTLAIFVLLEHPLLSLSDTILVCFVEAPDRLNSSAHELYQLLVDTYGRQLGLILHK